MHTIESSRAAQATARVLDVARACCSCSTRMRW
jgi:hypothetical protein